MKPKRRISVPVELVFKCILMISFAKNIQVYFHCTHSTDSKCINLRVINGSYKCIRRAMSYWKMTHDWVQQEQSQDFDLWRKEKAVVGRIRLGALSRRLYTQRQEEMTCQPASPPVFVQAVHVTTRAPCIKKLHWIVKLHTLLLLALRKPAVISSLMWLHS